MIKVYVKLNENNEITEIASSIFLVDATGWVEIDEGEGDKYAHAQSQYIAKPLTDKHGRCNYKLIDGGLVEIAEEDKPVVENEPLLSMEERVASIENDIKALLGV